MALVLSSCALVLFIVARVSVFVVAVCRWLLVVV